MVNEQETANNCVSRGGIYWKVGECPDSEVAKLCRTQGIRLGALALNLRM